MSRSLIASIAIYLFSYLPFCAKKLLTRSDTPVLSSITINQNGKIPEGVTVNGFDVTRRERCD